MDPYSTLRIIFYLFGTLVLALFSLYERAHAYVPKARFVLEKTARNHGRGFYQIQNDVIFRTESGSISVVETWIVENGESMYLETRGSAEVPALTIYKGRQKFYIDEQGQERSARVPADFFEDIFHYRTFESLAEELVRENILPQKALAKEPRVNSLKDTGFHKEPFIRLARSGGVVTYGIGKPTPADGTTPLPGIWIEQDRFHIKRLRLSSAAEILADEYADYGRGLSFPKSRSVSWGPNSVSIRTMKVSAIVPTAEQKAKLQPSSIRNRKASPANAMTDTHPLIKDFYSRFR
jgi:hypothetical protein